MVGAESAQGMVALSAALTILGTGVATAWAEKVIGAASVGALAEKPELFGRVLPLGGLGELKENAEFLQRLLKANEAEWRAGGQVYSNAKDEAAVRRIVGERYAGRVEGAGGVGRGTADG